MHATRHNSADDSDLEDIVVYAAEDSKNGRAAQAQQEGQTVRLNPGRNYVHLQQQLQSTRSATMTDEWSARSKADEVLGASAKMNLQQQFERSVAADRGGSALQRLIGHGCAMSVDGQSGDLSPAQKQNSFAANPMHCEEKYRLGFSLAEHSSPLERTSLAGPQERQNLPITARKRASKASFAIREPQPAGLSLKASLQQLRGTANTSQAPGGRERPAEDAIMSNAGEERHPQSRPLPSPSQALFQTLSPNPGMSAGDTREPSKAGAGMSAQRSFLASVLKPGKRQNVVSSQQVAKRTGRAGMNGPLTGRLQSVVQEEEQLSARGNGNQHLQVQVTEREQQGSIVTCRCSVVSGSFTAQSVIALFKSTTTLETVVGSRLTICSPWRECTAQGTSSRIIFVLAAYNSTEG